MKLVELLALELEKWPESDFEQGSIESMSQAGDMQVSHYSGVRQVWREDVNDWSGHDYVPCSRFTLPELATDHATAIVTREMWEAERAKLKAPKANGDGWIRHRGGRCPVDGEVKVETRQRGGKIVIESAQDFWWEHRGNNGDIMAYKIHKPAEQPALVSEETIKPAEPGKFDAIAIRDRIRALDTQRAELEATYQRQISEIDGERVELVRRLASEGLALVGVVRQAESLPLDPKDWKVGDILRAVGNCGGFSFAGDLVTILVVRDDGGFEVATTDEPDYGWFFTDEEAATDLQWHSRPVKP